MRTMLIAGLMLVGVSSARAADGADPKLAFASLKALAGEWSGPDGKKVEYKVTAGGSVVQETLFPGQPHEMVSMYHLDGDTLRMTHYCGAGNQPRTKFDPKNSTAEHLVFLFDGGTNLDPARDAHMHEGRITIKDKTHIETEWDGYEKGKKAGSHKVSWTKK